MDTERRSMGMPGPSRWLQLLAFATGGCFAIAERIGCATRFRRRWEICELIWRSKDKSRAKSPRPMTEGKRCEDDGFNSRSSWRRCCMLLCGLRAACCSSRMRSMLLGNRSKDGKPVGMVRGGGGGIKDFPASPCMVDGGSTEDGELVAGSILSRYVRSESDAVITCGAAVGEAGLSEKESPEGLRPSPPEDFLVF